MIIIPLGYGFILSSIIFTFIFIQTKKNAKYYLAPLITFFVIIATIFASIFIIRGWTGMGTIFIAAGGLPAAIIGTLLIPYITKNAQPKPKTDKQWNIILAIIFIIILATMFI